VGAETTFTTTLLAEQPPAADGVLAGDLIVVGGGDPLLGDDDFLRTGYAGRGTSVARLVDVVTGAGISRIRGGVVGDGSLFSRMEDPAPSITALSFNQSTDERPVLFAARRITEALEPAGVVVEGRPAGRRTTATGFHELGTVASLPLLNLLTVGLYESDNVIIATAAKRMSAIDGKRGSSHRSARMIERFAADHGARIDITTPTGLGEGNQCTPEAPRPTSWRWTDPRCGPLSSASCRAPVPTGLSRSA
jgi:D-alanyl-D-alanine carboxypeptidase/D-alanyl-D-alanine-endopeptidase (penicillin-binding protein 4)